jgi:predicted transcriptional regulator
MVTPKKLLPKTTIVRTTIRLPDVLLQRAKHRAIDEARSFQEIVERALGDYLRKQPARKQRKGGER